MDFVSGYWILSSHLRKPTRSRRKAYDAGVPIYGLSALANQTAAEF